jgi:7,8-dihydropterin-6-yl-methyl-4-(beta-D-ribofuranosyl)aminobenzene 5'-phosphate synthase
MAHRAPPDSFAECSTAVPQESEATRCIGTCRLARRCRGPYDGGRPQPRKTQETPVSQPDNQYLGNATRRRLLKAAPGSLIWTLAGGLLGPSGLVQAQPVADGAVPQVDRLAVRVVTDSYHHAFEPTKTVRDLRIQRYAFGLRKDAAPRTLLNEWGLSLHLESARGSEQRQVLVDFGYTADTLNNNLELLGIDVGRLDALVLSHGHYDHFGGLVGFLRKHEGKLRGGTPFVLGGEECFCTREAGVGDSAGNFGALDREAIRAARLQVQFAERPSLIAGHAFSTGRIPNDSFERVLAPTRMSVGMKDGMGCAPEGLPEAKRAATAMIPDDFQHEQATAFVVRDKGLVVMTSCGHRGIVNSVAAAQKVSGVKKVHAILGGFHLAPHAPDYQRQTAQALKALEPDWLIPMHCSGETFIAIAQQEFGDRLVRSSSGTRFVFGAA